MDNFVKFPVGVKWNDDGYIKRDDAGKKIITAPPNKHQQIYESRLIPEGYATAVGCGLRSKIFVLDFDTMDNPLMSELQAIEPTYTVKTGKGFHLYYKYFEGSNAIGKVNKVDIRSTGTFVFAPPTKGYDIMGECEPTEFTQDHRIAYEAYIDKNTATLKQYDLPVVNCRDSVEKIAQSYRPLRSGEYEGGRDTYLIAIGDSLMTYFKDDEPKRQAIIREVATKVFIDKIEDESDLTRIFTQSRNFILSQKLEEPEEETKEMVTWTANSIFKEVFPQIKYNLGGWIVMNKCNMISAQPGSMKSFMLLYWGHCLATGTDAYGSLETDKTPVMYLDGEDDVIVFNERLKKLQLEGTEDFHYTSSFDKKIDLYDKEYKETLFDYCNEHKIKVIIFDSLGVLMNGDDSDQEAVSQFHDILMEFIQEGFTPIVIHHNNKGAGTSKTNNYNIFDYVRGSTKIQAFYRMMWSILQTENKNVRILANTKPSYKGKLDNVEIETRINGKFIEFKLNTVVENTRIFSNELSFIIKDHPSITKSDILEKLQERKKGLGLKGVTRKGVSIEVERLVKNHQIYVINGVKNAKHCFDKKVDREEAESLVNATF